MASVYTAQCGPDLICKAVTETTTALVPPPGETFVALESYDISVLGKRWNPAAQRFEDVEQ